MPYAFLSLFVAPCSSQADTGISNKATVTLDSLVNNVFEHIAMEASKTFCSNLPASTRVISIQLETGFELSPISSHEIQTAIWLTLPGELAKRAITEGMKSVIKVFFCHH